MSFLIGEYAFRAFLEGLYCIIGFSSLSPLKAISLARAAASSSFIFL